MKLKRIYTTEITNMLLENNYYDVAKLTYDYDTQRVMYDGEEFEPKLEAWKFGLHFFIECNYKHFQDAVYCLSRLNTPKPEKQLDILCEQIEKWLVDNNKTQVTVLDVIDNCFGKNIHLTQRQLEIKVGRALRDLGYEKVKKAKYNIWVKKD